MTRCNQNLGALKWLLVVIILLPLFAVPSSVYAMDEPTGVSLDNIKVFGDLLTTGDALFYVPYDIVFTTQPDDNINDTFIFRLLSDNATVEVAATLANPAYGGGYGQGDITFYIESGITWGATYTIRVQENPAFYPSPVYWDFTVSSADYSAKSDQAEALKAKVISSATLLSIAFSESLLTTESGNKVLSTAGELYYLQVIPGLQNMCPTLFSVQLETPDFTKRTWSTTLADSLQTKYADTFLYDFMTGYAGLFDMETGAATGYLSVLLFIAVCFVSVWKFRATILAAFLDGYAFLLLLMLGGDVLNDMGGVYRFLLRFYGGAGVIL